MKRLGSRQEIVLQITVAYLGLRAASPRGQIAAATPEAAPGAPRRLGAAHRMTDIKPDEQIVVDTMLGEFDAYLWKPKTLRGN